MDRLHFDCRKRSVPCETCEARIAKHGEARAFFVDECSTSTGYDLSSNPEQTYISFTTDSGKVFKAHNAGQSVHTARYKPWDLVTYLAFNSEKNARDFEKYLKSHSGMAFASEAIFTDKGVFATIYQARPIGV